MKFSQLLSQNPETVAAGAALWTHKGHIEGNKMVWLSGSGLRLTSGSAYIPSLGYAIDAPTDIDKTGLVLAPSTWYHLYRYVNAGVPDFEIVTTAPAVPYSGTARSKTGDTSRRYVGSAKTDGSGAIYAFKHHSNGSIIYMANIIGVPFLVVSGGVATTATNVDLSALVPVTSKAAYLQARNTDTSVAVALGTSDQGYTTVSSAFQSLVDPNSAVVALVNTNDSQVLNYLFRSAPTGQFNVRCTGYVLER